MSFIARNNLERGGHHRSSSSLYEDDNANQHEEYQSTHSELPAEIPDSQPDEYLPAEIPDSQPDPYLPAEIPDSQPDLAYYAEIPFDDLDYSEVSPQSKIRDHSDIQLGNASAFEFGDYDFSEDEVVDPGDRVYRFERLHREELDESVENEALDSSSSGDTEIILGGTRLTKRVVGFFRYSPILSSLSPICFESSRPQRLLKCYVMYSALLADYVR